MKLGHECKNDADLIVGAFCRGIRFLSREVFCRRVVLIIIIASSIPVQVIQIVAQVSLLLMGDMIKNTVNSSCEVLCMWYKLVSHACMHARCTHVHVSLI